MAKKLEPPQQHIKRSLVRAIMEVFANSNPISGGVARIYQETYPPKAVLAQREWAEAATNKLNNHEEVIEGQGEEITAIRDRMESFETSVPIATSLPLARELIDKEVERTSLQVRRARQYQEFDTAQHALRFAEQLSTGEYSGASPDVRSRALGWAVRFLSSHKPHRAAAHRYLDLAKNLAASVETKIAEAFLQSADGDEAAALSTLSRLDNRLATTASLFVVVHHRGGLGALAWWDATQKSYSDLDSDGKFLLLAKTFEAQDWDRALQSAEELTANDFDEVPQLLHLAGMAHLFQAVPAELRVSMLQQAPFEARQFPLASDATALQHRQTAARLFLEAAEAARRFACSESADAYEDYAIWVMLRAPSNEEGLEALRASMRDPNLSLRRAHLAFQYGLDVDVSALEREIERQIALSGGPTANTAVARLSLAFAQKSRAEVAQYIAKHRAQLEKHLVPTNLARIEIEMLAWSGAPRSAETRLNELIAQGIPEEEQRYLRHIISEAEDEDLAETRRAQFEASGALSDLMNLVSALEGKSDADQLLKYGKLLFEATRALPDAERVAGLLNSAGKFEDLTTFLSTHAELVRHSHGLRTLWAWTLFRNGEFEKCNAELSDLRREADNESHRHLAVRLAIESGAWEQLPAFIEHEYAERERRTAQELLRAAKVATDTGLSRAKDLVRTAVRNDAGNPHILLAGYELATRGGWETEPDVGQWLGDAIKLSGPDGPIRQFSMEEVVAQGPEWEQHQKEAWQKSFEATVPLFVVAGAIRKSLVDVFLLPFLANAKEPDIRARAVVPAFSGKRIVPGMAAKSVGIDATALLTLGALGLLQDAFELFETIRIPHGTLGWLFEEVERAQFHQPSRIKVAHQLRLLLANGSLMPFVTNQPPDQILAEEVGQDLAAYFVEARAARSPESQLHFVVRPSPVHRINTFMKEEADLTRFEEILCSCADVIEKLRQRGQLTASQAQRAFDYLSLHERPWPQAKQLPDNAVLYLDDVTVAYLEHVNVLDKLRAAGLEAYVSAGEIKEADGLLQYEAWISDARTILERIRSSLAGGMQSGTVRMHPAPDQEAENENLAHPTAGVLAMAAHVEAIIVDDRFVNQHRGVSRTDGETPILTSLEVIAAIAAHDAAGLQLFELRTRLRQGCFAFLPLTLSELTQYLNASTVIDGALAETAELRAIREYHLKLRMTRFLQRDEVLWLNAQISVFMDALYAQWNGTVDETTAKLRSDWLWSQIDLRGWSPAFAVGTDTRGVRTAQHLQLSALAMVPPDVPASMLGPYWAWFEETIISNLRETDPTMYASMLSYADRFVAHIVANPPTDSEDDDGNG